MRFLIKASLPTEQVNDLLHKPEFPDVISRVLADMRAEATYFGLEGGRRAMYVVAEAKETHDLPRLAEPFWLRLGAEVECIPVMNAEEFAKAGPLLAELTAR
jgi:hypothetical protein